jgi:uncharacterized protein with PhoU and TrkA domain
MAFIVTRIYVGDYDTWKTLFDQDVPRTRADALNHRVLRNVDDPNEVYIVIEFASTADAQAAADRLIASGVLDRFEHHSGPMVTEVAEFVEGPG